jgi:hypothetical protein
MTLPLSVLFGPSARVNRWWALLPSTTVLYAEDVNALLRDVERAMARDEPNRPFAFVLDLYGAREPGEPVRPPRQGSAANRLAEQRRPLAADTTTSAPPA